MSRRKAPSEEQPSRLFGFAEAAQACLQPSDKLSDDRIRTVLDAARRSGMLDQKSTRISGRISPALVEKAKRRSGMESDTDLLEFALASVALDDPFVEVFEQVRGAIGPDVELGY